MRRLWMTYPNGHMGQKLSLPKDSYACIFYNKDLSVSYSVPVSSQVSFNSLPFLTLFPALFLAPVLQALRSHVTQ